MTTQQKQFRAMFSRKHPLADIRRTNQKTGNFCIKKITEQNDAHIKIPRTTPSTSMTALTTDRNNAYGSDHSCAIEIASEKMTLEITENDF